MKNILFFARFLFYKIAILSALFCHSFCPFTVDKAEQAPIIEQEVQQQPQPKMEYKQEKSVVQQEMSDDEFFAGVNA